MKLSFNALFEELYKDIVEACPSVGSPDDMTPRRFACRALLDNVGKKFSEAVNADADELALGKFMAANLRCRDWVYTSERMQDDYLLGEFTSEVNNFLFYDFACTRPLVSDLPQLFQLGGLGPGASAHADGTDLYTKLFSGPISCTSASLYRVFKRVACSYNPRWLSALNTQSLANGYPHVDDCSKLDFVPKNDTISRCICIEPSLNMFFQKGLGSLLERRLSSLYGLDIRVQQDRNKRLARIGSQTDRLSTIDLSAASDSISMGMLSRFFPADFVNWLKLFRSPKVRLPSGEEQELHMVSSMGNGFTFPLETLIFSCVVRAVYRTKGVEPSRADASNPNWGCFGDDIICRSDCYDSVCRLLQLLGFIPNTDKSFASGPFRESCGGDFYQGSPVRPVFIKSLDTQQSRYVAINRLNEWSALHAVPLQRTIRLLRRSVKFVAVPLYENDDAGIKMPLSLCKDRLRFDRNTYGYKYRAWLVRPLKIRIEDCDIIVPKGSRRRIYNPDGLLLAFLNGNVECSTIILRPRRPYYITKSRLSSGWDYHPFQIESGLACDFVHHAFTLNLVG